MPRSQQMVIASVIYGAIIAVLAVVGSGALVPVAIVGGALVGLGWAFYANKDSAEREHV